MNIQTPCGRCSGRQDVRLYITTAPRSNTTGAEMICCRCLPNLIGDGFTIRPSLEQPRTSIAQDFAGSNYRDGWARAYRLLCSTPTPKKESLDATWGWTAKGFNDCMEFHYPAAAK